MFRLLFSVFGCILIFGPLADVDAQQTAAPSKREIAVKHKVEQLKSGAHISIIRLHAPEAFGNFISSEQDGFTFYDVDQKTNIAVGYEEVRKVKDGYGGYNSIHRKHIDPAKRLIGVAAGLGNHRRRHRGCDRLAVACFFRILIDVKGPTPLPRKVADLIEESSFRMTDIHQP